jgi:serine kinase of HPr protein (carbohydrate metabolism regulator)
VPDARDLLVHATAVAIEGCAALIRGPAGAGKSDLALRCIAQPASGLLRAHAALVADDQVLLRIAAGRATAHPPEAIRGLIEVRGLGIVPVPYVAEARVCLLANLVEGCRIERLPEPDLHLEFHGISLPYMELSAFEASAPIKLLLALQRAAEAP